MRKLITKDEVLEKRIRFADALAAANDYHFQPGDGGMGYCLDNCRRCRKEFFIKDLRFVRVYTPTYRETSKNFCLKYIEKYNLQDEWQPTEGSNCRGPW